MITALTSRPWLLAAIAFVIGVVLMGLVWALSAVAAGPPPTIATPTVEPGRTDSPSPSASESESEPEPEDEPESESSAPIPPPDSRADEADCSGATTTVSSSGELNTALEGAGPGDVIVLESGQYIGEFVATASGTESDPIMLCGPQDAVLDGGDWKGDYVFHLDGAQYWHLLGFSVTNGQKGVMADGTVGSTIEGLTVYHTGDEAIHLRKHSTDNRVVGNDVSDTGLRRDKFGEGIYIGTADSNWCTITDCEPDRSDRNLIEGNYIHGTTSESVDIKEGTSNGILRGNTFEGSSIIAADSWVDVKGSDWIIEGNTGTDSPLDGFQTHEIGKGGWGTRNVFRNNVADVNGPGFGYSLTPERDNVVECNNTASGAGEGFSNVECR